jgi:hypothetical protein
MIRGQCLPVPATGGTRLTLFKRRFIALFWLLPKLFRGSGAENYYGLVGFSPMAGDGRHCGCCLARGIAVQTAAQLGLLVVYLEQHFVGGVGLA